MLTLNSLFLFVAFIMIFNGLWAFASNRKHLFNTQLSLEFIMLGIFFLMSNCLSSVGNELLVLMSMIILELLMDWNVKMFVCF